MPRENQFSVYLEPIIAADLEKLLNKYPSQSRSAFVAAAVKFYLPYALRGIDGNLQPYTLKTGPRLEPEPDTELLRSLIREILNEKQGPEASNGLT